MKLIIIVCLFISCCAAVPVATHRAVIFEPLFFSVVDDIDGEDSPSIKGRSRNIPVRLPFRGIERSSVQNNNNFREIGFPTATTTSIPIEGLNPDQQIQLFFPDGTRITNEPTTERTIQSLPERQENKDCPVKHSLIMYQDICSRLLSTQSCEKENHWLVVDVHTHEPKCYPMPCSLGKLYYKGQCVDIENNWACGVNEIFYIEHNGQVYCDCQPYFIFDKNEGKCIEEHGRGSCPIGYYLEKSAQNGASCVYNPCTTENLVLNRENGQCYRKLYFGYCDTKGDINTALQFDNSEGTVNCINLNTKNIFEVPALTSCPTDSRRDYFGKCQTVLRFGATSPFAYRVPSIHTTRYSSCPKGYTKYPNGSCRKINDILG